MTASHDPALPCPLSCRLEPGPRSAQTPSHSDTPPQAHCGDAGRGRDGRFQGCDQAPIVEERLDLRILVGGIEFTPSLSLFRQAVTKKRQLRELDLETPEYHSMSQNRRFLKRLMSKIRSTRNRDGESEMPDRDPNRVRARGSYSNEFQSLLLSIVGGAPSLDDFVVAAEFSTLYPAAEIIKAADAAKGVGLPVDEGVGYFLFCICTTDANKHFSKPEPTPKLSTIIDHAIPILLGEKGLRQDLVVSFKERYADLTRNRH